MLTESELVRLRRRCEAEPAATYDAETVVAVLQVLDDERAAHAETQNELAWVRGRWEAVNAALRRIIETYVDPVEPAWWERNPQRVARDMQQIATAAYTGGLPEPTGD